MITKVGKTLSDKSQDPWTRTALPTGLGALAGGIVGGLDDYTNNLAKKEDYAFWNKAYKLLNKPELGPKPPKMSRYGLPIGLAAGAALGYLPRYIEKNYGSN